MTQTTNQAADVKRNLADVIASDHNECPGCSGVGVYVFGSPSVCRCQGCGGVFTAKGEAVSPNAARVFVAFHEPMKAEAGLQGQFYFDLVIEGPTAGGGPITKSRAHGWADRETKRIVQWG